MAEQDRVVIHGTREDGSRLRPGDWIERLSSTMATFNSDRRLRYSDSIRPCVIDGQKCLVMDCCLADVDPNAYRYIMSFAESNHLQVQIVQHQAEHTLSYSAPASAA